MSSSEGIAANASAMADRRSRARCSSSRKIRPLVQPQPLPDRVTALDGRVERADAGLVPVHQAAVHADDQVTVALVELLQHGGLRSATGVQAAGAQPLVVGAALLGQRAQVRRQRPGRPVGAEPGRPPHATRTSSVAHTPSVARGPGGQDSIASIERARPSAAHSARSIGSGCSSRSRESSTGPPNSAKISACCGRSRGRPGSARNAPGRRRRAARRGSRIRWRAAAAPAAAGPPPAAGGGSCAWRS